MAKSPRLLGFRPYEGGDLGEVSSLVDMPCDAGKPVRAYTLLRDGVPVGCGGFTLQKFPDGNRFSAWAVLGDLSRRERVFAVRKAAQVLALHFKAFADPVVASAHADDPAALRTLERLGFRPNGHRFVAGGHVHVQFVREA